MNKKITFAFFLAIVIVVGVFFFRITQPFLLPLLIAGILALLVQPIFQQGVASSGDRRRLMAALTTLLILVLVVLPIAAGIILAAQQLIQFGEGAVSKPNGSPADHEVESLKSQLPAEDYDKLTRAILAGATSSDAASSEADDGLDDGLRSKLASLKQQFSTQSLEDSFRKHSDAAYLDTNGIPLLKSFEEYLRPFLADAEPKELQQGLMALGQALLSDIYDKTSSLISNLVNFVVGFAVMTLGLYYFLAEGPQIVQMLEELLPIETRDEKAVFREFEKICRGIVLGTIVAALVQAVLLGIGLAVLGVPGVWILASLTVICSMVPFVGSAGVYIPVSAYLAWSGRYTAAVVLLAYGGLLVSTADNLVRAYVIHGTSRLHPLVALVSVLGAIQVVGLWGILVGPIVAGIFYTLLKILREKLERMSALVPASQ